MPSKVPTHNPRRIDKAILHRDYDRTRRDREAKSFYHTQRWLKVRAIKLRQDPFCERHLAEQRLVQATVVHHRVELGDDPSLALDIDNLESLCSSCHSRHHKGRSHQS